MNIEIYLLCIFVGMTLLGYLIAINSHGPTRLSVSYLIATLMLAGTVWGIVQYVNSGLDKQQMEQFKRLENEKQRAEERIRTQEQQLLENKQLMTYAAKISDIITEGTGLSTTMMNTDLRDFSQELDVLMGRAEETRRKCKALQDQFEKIRKEQDYFTEGKKAISQALTHLVEASSYYTMYFRSEDGAQEEMRERVMRRKARDAYELLKNAASDLASQG
jgi:hypothetical protein